MSSTSRGPEVNPAVATAAAAATGARPGVALRQPSPPAAPSAAPLSPSVIQLAVQSGAVVAPELGYTVVLDMLHKAAAPNPEASRDGGVVLGVASPLGPVTTLDLTIGQLNFKRLLACARNKLWWMTPEWRSATWAMPPETQFLLAEMAEGGPYALLLPLIDGDFRATLRAPGRWAAGP
ncbi:hypothetical protein HYH03_012421 [Edaphochlamys debaryana]|uniref:Uncharacterized protein n=1 Tax=Edaphochlamys debaryana TaxID=47281 RepID=A0A836BU25_9CHLO|nr:hypothetical protein HYH03_012421 [Edaphochlamys debaryana]|eukprot:KAG2488980.1 hypothetical protein HYH03_012421 [Edaphochlamys debaryana]